MSVRQSTNYHNHTTFKPLLRLLALLVSRLAHDIILVLNNYSAPPHLLSPANHVWLTLCPWETN